VVTQNQLLQYVREVRPGKEWEILDVDTEEVQRIGWEKWNAGEKGLDVQRLFWPNVSFGWGLGEFKEVDNWVLGLGILDEEGIKGVVAVVLQDI